METCPICHSPVPVMVSCRNFRVDQALLTLLVGRQEEHPACKKLSGEVLMSLSMDKVQILGIWSR